jgi:cysteine synthase A
MPDTMTIERRNLLKAYGAQVVLTPGAKGDTRGVTARQRDHERATINISCRSSSRIGQRRSIATTAEEIWREPTAR